MAHSLNWIDYLIIGLFFISILIGLLRGFIRELIAVLTWGVALLVAAFCATPLAEKVMGAWHLHEKIAGAAHSIGIDPAKSISLIAISVSFISIFIVVLIIGSIINYMISSAIELSGISLGNRLLGAVFGLFRGFLITFVLIFFIELSPIAQQTVWEESQFVHDFRSVVTPLMQWIKPNMQYYVLTKLWTGSIIA